MLKVLDQIVRNEAPLEQYSARVRERAAKIWGKGADECLITVKGAEAPAHMPQAKRSLALIYAVNPFGADHQSSEHDPYYEEGVGRFQPQPPQADRSRFAATRLQPHRGKSPLRL